MMNFSSKRGENHSNSELLRGFSTKCRRKIRIFMSQKEQNTAPGKPGFARNGIQPYERLWTKACAGRVPILPESALIKPAIKSKPFLLSVAQRCRRKSPLKLQFFDYRVNN